LTSVGDSWLESAEHAFESRQARPELGAFGRLWRVFMTARVAIAGVLIVLQAFIHALGNLSNRWSIAVCIAYLCATLAVRLWASPRPPRSTFDAQWLSTIGVDVLAFSLLNFLQAGGINYTPLFALPVLLSSILGPILLAFGTAASVTLLLLLEAWWSSLPSLVEFSGRFLQSGLSGTGFFLVALLANQLALRLAREEYLAKTSQSAARMQGQVNELVIEALADGVLVVDVHGVVRSANPASRRLLATQGTLPVAPFALATEAAWQPLAELMAHTFATQSPQQADLSLESSAGNARRLQVRTRLAASPSGTQEGLCVMFLEDLREMEARVRTEKMAAMGRMSAAVAHEIRNPLAAISQANALLEEDLHDPAQLQLTTMVRQNAQRLDKIVEEVLNISRAQEQIPMPRTTTLPLDETVLRIAADWARQAGAAQRLQLSPNCDHAAVWFEPEHLRRLLINLLDNALRYASSSAHAIEVATQMVGAGQARLSVWSDGKPLEQSVQTHLFEPFFSSESRSSGLGLYICRELCEGHGALIGYQRSTRVMRAGLEGNEFFVLFRPASLPFSLDPPAFDTLLV
jgi:two-component system, NtrC family, sensor histidine kinase PilS